MSARDQATIRQRPYLLSEEDHQYYYQEFIQRTYLDVSDSSIPPVAYFLGAQPGSGKTKLRVGLQTGAEVLINTDELRWIHPSYSTLLEDQRTNQFAGHLVNPDATDWSIRLRNDAIEERRSIMVDSTLGVRSSTSLSYFKRYTIVVI
ncbi:zeta toxin family protein [Dawidia soli]|uniref:Zeta toxin family protein n=1 Tax=Dawidia soli TaxID=2782352 RepID=A0AAP2D7J9_9BACT|nr:zeta toxin family protein [Dawidia soli]